MKHPLYTDLKTISVAVRSIDDILGAYVDGLGFKIVSEKRQSPRGYGLRWVELGMTDDVPVIELLEPIDDSGPVAAFLSKHPVSSVYQVRLGVRDLSATHTTLRQRGVETIEGVDVDGEPSVGWIHPRSTGGVLFELIEEAGESG